MDVPEWQIKSLIQKEQTWIKERISRLELRRLAFTDILQILEQTLIFFDEDIPQKVWGEITRQMVEARRNFILEDLHSLEHRIMALGRRSNGFREIEAIINTASHPNRAFKDPTKRRRAMESMKAPRGETTMALLKVGRAVALLKKNDFLLY